MQVGGFIAKRMLLQCGHTLGLPDIYSFTDVVHTYAYGVRLPLLPYAYVCVQYGLISVQKIRDHDMNTDLLLRYTPRSIMHSLYCVL